MSAERKQWFGRKAIEWVLDEVPNVPPNLVSTLVGLARHAQDDGTGAGPGVETLMGYTRKSKRQVKYDLDKLRELNLIKVSKDQSRVAHIRADRRPVVYDLAIGTACNPLHPADSRGATDCTPESGGGKPRGATERQTGCNTASDEVQPTAPEENYEENQEKNNPSLSTDRLSVPAPRDSGEEDRERDGSTSSSTPATTDLRQQIAIKNGAPADLAEQVVEYLEGKFGVRHIGWWTDLDTKGHLAIHVPDAVAALTAAEEPARDGERCPEHPNYPADTCGPCRSDRIARGNEQPRTSQRGQVTPRVNVPEGTHTAAWERRRQQHTSAGERKYLRAQAIGAELDAELGIRRQPGQHHPYRNPADQSAHDPWQPNAHLILDAEPEATP